MYSIIIINNNDINHHQDIKLKQGNINNIKINKIKK
jgi:hypothetical protein